MARRPKTARAIEANVGIRAKLRKRIEALTKEFNALVADEIILFLAKKHALAQDRSLSNPVLPEDKALLKEVRTAVLAAWARDNEAFRSDIEGYVDRNIARWGTQVNTAARKLAAWVARAIAADVTASQRSAYVAAGFSPDFLREKWTIPVVRQHIGKTAAARLPDLIKWSTELITKTSMRDLNRLQGVIAEGLANGQNIEAIRSTLASTAGFNADRARNVAIDQTNKITQGIIRANDEDLGITEGIWVHVPGQFSSRETHIAMNGERFKLNEGLYDPDVGHNVVPGECPYCRCVYRPVLPFDKLGLKR